MASQKILIVDDDDSILRLLEKRLQSAGYQIIKAATGKEAVAKAKLFMPHLILMDIMLPDIDGPEAFELIRENPDTAHLPVLFLSGIVSEQAGQQPSVKIKDEDYPAVAKPVDFEVLDQLIKEYILEN